MSRPESGGFGVAFDARAEMAQDDSRRGKAANTEETFWSRVRRDGPAVNAELGPCWPWTGRIADDGHGMVSWNGPERLVHRVAYSLTFGAIAARVVIRHRCDVPACCNPDHLVAGTIADNNADARQRGQARTNQLLAHAEASRGAGNVNAKLTDDRVRELRAAWRSGESIKSIALRTGLAVGTVHPMLHGRTWRHVVDAEVVAASDAGAALAARAAMGAEASRALAGDEAGTLEVLGEVAALATGGAP